MRWNTTTGAWALAILFAAALAVVTATLMPPATWVGTFWPRWATTLGFTALFAFACYSFGQLVLESLDGSPERDGRAAFAWAVGVLAFGLFTGVAGLFDLLTLRFFWALPLVMGAAGVSAVMPSLRRFADDLLQRPLRFSAAELFLLVLGVTAVSLLLLQVLSPDNINFDARWYHLRAAERYALAQGQVRTPEGDYLLALPQLSSWLYTWALLAPVPTLTDRLQLALHLELVTVLVTLATIPPLTRALVPELPRAATRLSWVAFFFFPSVFVYDTGVMGGSDHIAALWAAPMLLAWLQARAKNDWRSWTLWGVVTAGALAKYTALFLLLPLVLVVAVDWLWRFRAGNRTWRLGPVLAAGTTLVLAAPWWLRNWVWYHDPVYPMAQRLFGGTPWTEDAPYLLKRLATPTAFIVGGMPLRAREGTLDGTLTALADYWRELYTWADFTGGQPVFGFAFLLSLIALPFVRRSRLLWLTALLAHLGLIVWFNLKHEMRYLSILVPLMSAFVAAIAATLWAQGRLPLRLVLVGAVVVQLQIYGDLPFRRTSRTNGHRSPVEAGLDALARPNASASFVDLWAPVNATLPPRAVVLLHGVEPGLGLERQSVTDVPGLQFGLDFGRLGTVPALWQKLRDLGVTHVLWPVETEQLDGISGEALYRALTTKLVGAKTVGPWMLGELPPSAPADPGNGILYVGCSGLYKTGLYAVADLAQPVPNWPTQFPDATPRAEAPDWRALLPHAAAVVIEDGCAPATPPSPDFVATGIQRAPKRAWRHFNRTVGAPLPF